MRFKRNFLVLLGLCVSIELSQHNPAQNSSRSTAMKDNTQNIHAEMIPRLNILMVKENSTTTLLTEDYVITQLNIVFTLPILESLFESCDKEQLETMKTKIDSTAEFDQISKLAIEVRRKFLSEIRQKSNYNVRDRRTTDETTTQSEMQVHILRGNASNTSVSPDRSAPADHFNKREEQMNVVEMNNAKTLHTTTPQTNQKLRWSPTKALPQASESSPAHATLQEPAKLILSDNQQESLQLKPPTTPARIFTPTVTSSTTKKKTPFHEHLELLEPRRESYSK